MSENNLLETEINAIMDSMVSHALSLGVFSAVNEHEPKSQMGNAMTCAIWCDRIGPASGLSGLASTTGLLTFMARIYLPALQQPYDMIDANMIVATSRLIGAYTADFTFSDRLYAVDLQGMTGQPLEGRAGYLTQDSKLYRVMTITVPLIVNDVWEQVA